MSDHGSHRSPLYPLHEEAGASLIPALGIARHYGTPEQEYRAALDSVVVVDRSDRYRLELTGRAPGQMLNGIMTGSVPLVPTSGDGQGPRTGSGSYSAVLTPKGRMVTDLRAFSIGDAEERLLLDVPRAGGAGLLDHLARFVPPRFARVHDRSASTALITVIGPEAGQTVASLLSGLGAMEPGAASDLAGALLGGDATGCALASVEDGDPLVLARTTILGPLPSIDLLGDAVLVTSAWTLLSEGGVVSAGLGVFETLRVEAGTPAFGTDMSADTLPPEAGIESIAIDHTKGCYTGQEVIVRIRDRGHVNRHLRGLIFGDRATPPAGSELFQPGQDQPIGTVTSAVSSPRFGGVIGLGYVRRAVEPPAELRLGSGSGDSVGVRELRAGEWWPETG